MYNILGSLASCMYIGQARINITKILRNELWYRPLVRSLDGLSLDDIYVGQLRTAQQRL